MKKVVLVIPPERFRDEELFITQEILEKNGFNVVIASTQTGRCPGSRGGFATADMLIKDVNLEDSLAVVFIGGGGSTLLFNDDSAISLAKAAYAKNIVVAAICLAPVILANAGVLHGKNATVAGTKAKLLEENGAKYTGPSLTRDGKVLTANAPKATTEFATTLCEMLNG